MNKVSCQARNKSYIFRFTVNSNILYIIIFTKLLPFSKCYMKSSTWSIPVS